MEFRLLGPTEVLAPNGLVDIGPPRQRLVLAALLVDAGRTVLVDTVVDRVWGEDPPARARHSLYVYLARIRGILERSGTGGAPAKLVRRNRGYLLDIDPQRVDLHRFGMLVERAGHLGAEETATQRAALLREALDLWRGSPLADLDGDWAAQVREAWRRTHVDAATAWARCELDSGNHRDTVRRLTALVSEYPLVEPLAAELMRALHAAGLSAEALRCYADLSLRLSRELGIEPGPQLRALHRSIAYGEPADAEAEAGPSPPSPPDEEPSTVPRQLPATVWPFVGRPEELRWLDRLVREPQRTRTVVISAIDGAAGIGKTTLAVQWGHLVADRYPDGQLYINLRGFDPGGVPVEPSAAVCAFLDALDVVPQRIPVGLEAQAALLRSRLAGKRMLLLLDNARDAEQVRPLLPGTAGCLVIVTSRHQLTALHATEGASILTLGLLSTSEARDLLAARIGADRVALEPEAVDEIISRCGNLPLALVVAAARAAARPKLTLASMAEQMRAASSLDPFGTAEAGMDIRSVFSWSYEGISAPAARLFRLLGLHPGPDISLGAAASLAGCAPARARQLLSELFRSSLIDEYRPDRYAVHDLLRLFAAERVAQDEPATQRDAATHRLLDHYLHSAHAADLRVNPDRDPIRLPAAVDGAVPAEFTDEKQALDWFAEERRVLLALIEHAASSGRETHACRLEATLAHYLYLRGHWIDQVTASRTAVAAAGRGEDVVAKARAHHNLARAHLQLGDHELAHDQLTEAIRLAEESGDPGWQGNAHHVMSWVLERMGSHPEAFAHATRALGLFESAGRDVGRARALNTIGWFHTLTGSHEKAITFCQEALELLKRLGNKEGMAKTWHSIGYAQHHLGRHGSALHCYLEALTLFTELQDRYHEAETLHNIGDTLHASGDADAAFIAWNQALNGLEAMNHHHAEHVRAKLAARG
ncbi:MAG TPA: BTAD domain-containing putative transcriptional regulator [Candidatus Limnocylindrales bacterium]